MARSGPEPVSGDRGEVMVTTVVLLAALVLATMVLFTASEQWEGRRKAAAAAATMARAAAQGDVQLLRAGEGRIDPLAAADRVSTVVAVLDREDGSSSYAGRIVAIDDDAVTVEATVTLDYTFEVPGFPTELTGIATAAAVGGVDP